MREKMPADSVGSVTSPNDRALAALERALAQARATRRLLEEKKAPDEQLRRAHKRCMALEAEIETLLTGGKGGGWL